jgi:threonine dehydratase
VFAAEPETASPLAVSLAQGRASTFEGWERSFVDGAGGRSVLPSMWPLLSRLAAGSIVVSLADIAAAMKLAAERCHVIAEGAAACAIAAALTGRVAGKVVAIVSGGNIDLPAFAALVGASKEQ